MTTILVYLLVLVACVSSLPQPCPPCSQIPCPMIDIRGIQCEMIKDACGCCDVCAGNEGDVCSTGTPICRSDLWCVGWGIRLKKIPSYLPWFQGVCKNLENSNRPKELQNGFRTTPHQPKSTSSKTRTDP